MKKLQLFSVLTILLIAALGFASGNDPSATNGADRELPEGILNAEMFDLPWISGEWQFFMGGDDTQMEIVRREKGVYSIKADNFFMSDVTMYLIRSGCERLAIIDSQRDGGGGSVMFARVSGHTERLSLDLLPVVFPQAWSDPMIHELLEVEWQADIELPKEHRLAALALFAETIDIKGTFMEQDLTFYRPISLREMREMLNEEPQP